jgi:hypothetical protein
MAFPGIPVIDERDHDLAYLSSQAFGHKWRILLEALAGELFENFSPDEARGFFRQIGARVARQIPLPQTATLVELDNAIGAAISNLGWGYSRLLFEDNVMLVFHRAYPGAHESGTSAAWRNAFAALLEGLYTAWVQSQGGSPDLRAYVQEDALANGFVFRFGY